MSSEHEDSAPGQVRRMEVSGNTPSTLSLLPTLRMVSGALQDLPRRAWHTDSLRDDHRDGTCASRAEHINRSIGQEHGAGPGKFTSLQLLFLSVWEPEKIALSVFA